MKSLTRILIYQSLMDFRKRYLGTLLGALWAIIMPLCTITLIYFVISFGLKTGAMGEVSFANWLVPGMLVWFFISEGISLSTVVMVEYSYLITKMVFPVKILIPARLCATMPVHLLLMTVFMVTLLIRGEGSYNYWPQLIYYFFCACLLVYVIGLIASTLQVFVKDTANIVGVGLQMFFWATPLFWNPSMLNGTSFTFLLYSPFNYVVSGYRDSLFHGIGFWELPLQTAVFWIFCLSFLLIGYILFKRSRPHFADVL